MKPGFEDQAAGLRRLFRASPPEAIAVVSCGAGAPRWVTRQAQMRVRAGLQLVAFDEWSTCGNLADCLGVAPRFDLLQVAQRHVSLVQAKVDVESGFALLPVARLAQALAGGERVLRQRTLDLLAGLQAGADEWLIHARPGELLALSPLAQAAPRLLLAVEPQPRGITEAYAVLKRMRAGVDMLSIGLAPAGQLAPSQRALMENLCAVARRSLGLEVHLVSSLGEAFCLGEPEGEHTPHSFAERLLFASQRPLQRYPGGARI